MSLFYDPSKKQTQPWVKVLIVLIPIALVILLLVLGGPYAAKKNSQNQKEEVDIFKK